MRSETWKQIYAYSLVVAAVALGKVIGNDMQFAFYLLIHPHFRLMSDICEANRIFPYKIEFNWSLFKNPWFVWGLMYGAWCAVSHIGKLI